MCHIKVVVVAVVVFGFVVLFLFLLLFLCLLLMMKPNFKVVSKLGVIVVIVIVFVVGDPRLLPLKFGQNWFSNS